MFNPKREVLSLKTAKKLKELGYPQKGDGWYYVRLEKQKDWKLLFKQGRICIINGKVHLLNNITEFIKAPTKTEIREILKKEESSEKN